MDLLWVGTDVLFMNKFPKGMRLRFKVATLVFRVCVKILDKFYIQRNWVVADHLIDELKLKRPKMKIEIPRMHPDKYYKKKYPKKKHEGFNILYYHPKNKNNPEFIRWLYGIDIIDELKIHYRNKVNWIRADSSLEMDKTYPIVDFYVRPNRHDGMPFMIQECDINGIPYYWSKNNPSKRIAIKRILNEYKSVKLE